MYHLVSIHAYYIRRQTRKLMKLLPHPQPKTRYAKPYRDAETRSLPVAVNLTRVAGAST